MVNFNFSNIKCPEWFQGYQWRTHRVFLVNFEHFQRFEIPNRHSLVQSQKCNYQKNLWDMFKINKKDTRTTSDVILVSYYIIVIFFSIWVFFHNHSRITGLQGKGEDISLTPHCHFLPLHRHLDISRNIRHLDISRLLRISKCRLGLLLPVAL